MDEEIFNPRRMYRLFRPRQAMRGRSNTGVPTNRATISLYNNSTGRAVQVVRDISIAGTAGDTVSISYVQTQIGSTVGQQAHLVSNEPILSGVMNSIDTATVYSGDYLAPLSAQGIFVWQHDYPFAVLENGYSLVFQCSTAAHAIAVALIWESIEIDQLDFFY